MGIEDKINQLPPERQAEVIDFVDFLLAREPKKSKHKIKCDWRGGLKQINQRFTSVELQHEATNWRIEDESSR